MSGISVCFSAVLQVPTLKGSLVNCYNNTTDKTLLDFQGMNDFLLGPIVHAAVEMNMSSLKKILRNREGGRKERWK